MACHMTDIFWFSMLEYSGMASSFLVKESPAVSLTCPALTALSSGLESLLWPCEARCGKVHRVRASGDWSKWRSHWTNVKEIADTC